MGQIKKRRLFASSEWQARQLKNKLPVGWDVMVSSVSGERYYLDLEWGINRVSTVEDLVDIIKGTNLTLKDFKHLNKTVGPRVMKMQKRQQRREAIRRRKEIRTHMLLIDQEREERLVSVRASMDSYESCLCPGIPMSYDCLSDCRCWFCETHQDRHEVDDEVQFISHSYIVGEVAKAKIKSEPPEEVPEEAVVSGPSHILINTMDLTSSLCTPTTKISTACGMNNLMSDVLTEIMKPPESPMMEEIPADTSIVFSQPPVMSSTTNNCSLEHRVDDQTKTLNLEELHTVYGKITTSAALQIMNRA